MLIKARVFFYVAVGLFLLALSYHLGALTATAQGQGNQVVGITGETDLWAVTTRGDVYYGYTGLGTWEYRSNIFGGGPTPAHRESVGTVKVRPRAQRGAR